MICKLNHILVCGIFTPFSVYTLFESLYSSLMDGESTISKYSGMFQTSYRTCVQRLYFASLKLGTWQACFQLSLDSVIYEYISNFVYELDQVERWNTTFESNWQLKLKEMYSMYVWSTSSVSAQAHLSTDGVIVWGEENLTGWHRSNILVLLGKSWRIKYSL